MPEEWVWVAENSRANALNLQSMNLETMEQQTILFKTNEWETIRAVM